MRKRLRWPCLTFAISMCINGKIWNLQGLWSVRCSTGLQYDTKGRTPPVFTSPSPDFVLQLAFCLPLFRLSSSATSSWWESPVTHQLNHFQTYIYGWSQTHYNKPMLRSRQFLLRSRLTRPTLTYHTYFLRTNISHFQIWPKIPNPPAALQSQTIISISQEAF